MLRKAFDGVGMTTLSALPNKVLQEFGNVAGFAGAIGAP
jgi:hypothetical protein